MTGNYADLYEFQAIEVDEGSMDMASVGGIYNFSVNPVGDTASADFTAPVTKKGQGFIYVDCRAAKDISVSVRNKDTGETRDSWTVTPHEPYIIDAGTLGTDYEVCVTVGAESAATGNIYVAIMDDAVLQQDMQTLSAGGMQVSSFSDSRIDGKLTAPEDGAVFTSIPYDAGWTVTVDGVKVGHLQAWEKRMWRSSARGPCWPSTWRRVNTILCCPSSPAASPRRPHPPSPPWPALFSGVVYACTDCP